MNETEKIIEEYNIGDKVWQFADAKEDNMLMIITGKSLDKNKDVVYTTEYLDKDYVKRLGWKKKTCKNLGKYLRHTSRPYPEDLVDKKLIEEARKQALSKNQKEIERLKGNLVRLTKKNVEGKKETAEAIFKDLEKFRGSKIGENWYQNVKEKYLGGREK